jgi:poly-gamma-glutamate capsule biosynthesis protein CapA/YwtB (metallophosphatase superfamily)
VSGLARLPGLLTLCFVSFTGGSLNPPVPAPIRPTAPRRTTLMLGGDVMLARSVGQFAKVRSDPAAPFRELAPVLSAADITFVNLESPFAQTGTRFNPGMIFRAAPEMVEGLTAAGVDVVSTANNHSRDAFSEGIPFTLDWLAGHHIAAAGTGHTPAEAHQGVVIRRNGIRFGFLAYTYDQRNGNYADDDARIAALDEATLRQDIASLRERTEVIVVSMHAGLEYFPRPVPQQVQFAHAAIDAGAAVVVGHHPHVVQPTERYKDGVIFYSLGNLVFDQFQRRETQQGMLAEVSFLEAKLGGYQLLPIVIVESGPRLQLAALRASVSAPKPPSPSPNPAPVQVR